MRCSVYEACRDIPVGISKSVLSITFTLLLAATPLYAGPSDTQTAGEVKALIPAAWRNAQPVSVKDALA